MIRTASVALLAVSLTVSKARAEDIDVQDWKDGTGILATHQAVAKTKLPPNARVKIRVVTLNKGFALGTSITVNGKKVDIKAMGDELRAETDKDGGLVIEGPGKRGQGGGFLSFGEGDNYVSLRVRVSD